MINLTKIQIQLFFLGVFLFSFAVSQAQNYKKEIKSAEEAFLSGNYDKAAEHYLNASKAIKKFKKKHLSLFYKLGYCQMQLKDYQQAANSFGKYQSLAKRLKPNLKELKEVTEWRDWCVSEFSDFGQPKGQFDPNIQITNLATINSSLNDYGAFMTYDKNFIIFSSNRMTESDKDLIDINHDVYIAEYKNGELSAPVRIGNLSEKFDEISSSISSDNLTIYFSLSKDNGQTSDIYVSRKIAGVWSTPEKLQGEINSKYWDGDPSISPDGKTLYFVSNRPGSRGMDIYFSVRQPDGTWSTPKNIGYPINTKFDEISPQIDSTGKRLYFSSKGHIGYGGFDIYYSEFEASNLWGEPVNLGLPINSDRDDIYYTPTQEPGVALFSSKRPGGKGIYDIYKAQDIRYKTTPSHKPSLEEIVKKEEMPPIPEKKEVKEEKKEDFQEVVVKNIQTQKEPAEKEKKTEVVTQKELVQKEVPPQKPEPEQPVATQKTVATASTTNTRMRVNIYTTAIPDLFFKVQIGAYRNHITKYHPVFTSRLNPEDITEEYYPPLYKYTIGHYNTIKSATEFKMHIRKIGYSDAFLTCYYKNNRIPMDEAKKVIIQNARPN